MPEAQSLPPPRKDPENYQMDLFDHLRELRKRMLFSIAAITVGALIAYWYSTYVFEFLSAPYFKSFPNQPLIGTSPAEAWTLKLKTAVAAGTLLVSPFILFQVWLFVAPGLYDHERKMMLPFVYIGTLLFLFGAAFCYYSVLPIALDFFNDEYISIGVTPNVKIGDYLSMTITMIVAFGSVFELPLAAYFLARAGIIDHKTLLSQIRIAVVIIFVVAAVLSPPDVLSQFLMAVPLMLLYGISIGVAWLAARPAEENS